MRDAPRTGEFFVVDEGTEVPVSWALAELAADNKDACQVD